jgi:ElaA protein
LSSFRTVVSLEVKLTRVSECSLSQKSWSALTTDELYALLKLRTDVFFVEQRIDEEELDGRDQEPTTRHLWISDETGIVAYLRVIADDEPAHLDARTLIGRVVVRADRRGRGLALRLIERVLEESGDEALALHSQEYVQGLYRKVGFVPVGDRYVEAGLPHVLMYRPAGGT